MRFFFRQHCADDDSTTRPLYLVTASVDKMVLKKAISADVDLRISGAVTWVGRSSIEIQLDVTQPPTGNSVQEQYRNWLKFACIYADYLI